MRSIIPIFVLLLAPAVTHAQTVQTLFSGIGEFLNGIVIPFLLGIAFLFFIINVIRFFVLQGHSQDGREKAKNLTIYSIAAFVLIIIFWGIVNMLASSIGLEGKNQPQSDYVTAK